jgi:hypothetical protein
MRRLILAWRLYRDPLLGYTWRGALRAANRHILD